MEPIDLAAEREKRNPRDEQHALLYADSREIPEESRDADGWKVPGSREDGAFVCTACGAKFVAKGRQFEVVGDDIRWYVDAVRPPAWGLEDHWSLAPACRSSLARPVGQFGAPTPGKHCPTCPSCRMSGNEQWMVTVCPTHAHRGCPGC